MNSKKAPQADLEKKRSVFLQTGYIAALALAISAFTWTEYNVAGGLVDPDSGLNILVIEDDIIPYHVPEKPKPKPETKVIIDKFIIDETPDPDPDPKEKEKLPEIEFDPDAFGLNEGDTPPDIIIKGNTGPVNFMAVEQKPYYKDCENVLDDVAEMQCTHLTITRYINSHARFPARAKDRGRDGTVMVSFVINKKGKVEQVKVEDSVDPDLDKEAVRVVESLPDFVPGSQQGRKVKVAYKIPVRFVLR
jgi:protein TonB